LKEKALDRIKWRARFGRGLGLVVRQTTKWMNSLEVSFTQKFFSYPWHVWKFSNFPKSLQLF
jgi:hypothetical protein